MATKIGTNSGRSYEDFVPYCKWQSNVDHDILEVHPHGFKKDQLKVQINNQGLLAITGERLVEGNKWSRFRQEMIVSKDCITNQIHAKFSGGVLYITMPKKTPAMPRIQLPTAITLPQQEQQQTEAPKPDTNQNQVTAKEDANNITSENKPRSSVHGLKASFSKLKMSKETSVRVAIAVAVVVMLALGGYVIYGFLQPSPHENWIAPQDGN